MKLLPVSSTLAAHFSLVAGAACMFCLTLLRQGSITSDSVQLVARLYMFGQANFKSEETN